MHVNGIGDDFFDLLLPFFPDSLHRTFLAVKGCFHRCKAFHDGFNIEPESVTGKEIVEQVHLVPLVFLGCHCEVDLDNRFTQDSAQAFKLLVITDPDSFFHSHSFKTCRHGISDQHTNISSFDSDVSLELFYPSGLKVLGAFALVIDLPTILSRMGIDDLYAVATTCTLLYFFDSI